MSPLFGKKTDKKEEKAKDVAVASEANTTQTQTATEDIASFNFDSYLQPYITEKTTMLSQDNQYVFIVRKSLNKYMVKSLVEKNYKVKIANVNLIRITVQPTRFGFKKQASRKGGYKKAIVTLKEGYKIDLAI